MAKKKNKLLSGYYDANTGTLITNANIVEDSSGWKIEKNKLDNLNTSTILSSKEPTSKVRSKVMTPAPQVKMTIDSINNKINTNINQKIISGGIENEIHNMNMKNIGKTSLDKNIDLSGKSVMGKTTPVSEEGIERTQNELMTKKELREKKKDLEKQIRDYDRKEKVQWWTDGIGLDNNIKNIGYKLFAENQNTKYKEDKEYDKLVKRKDMVQEELDNRFVDEQSQNMSTINKIEYTFNGNTERSLRGIESTIAKITGQDVPEVKDSYNMRLADEARRQSSGAEGVGLDVLGSYARMLPQMIITGGTGSETAGLAVGFANYGGDAYNEAKKMGATEEQATKYGLTIGTLEMGLEKLLGGMEGIYGKSVLGKTTNRVMTKVISNPILRKILTNASSEFTEEYLQEFLEPIVKNIILEEDNGADFWNSENLSEGIKRLSSQLFNGQNLYAGTLGAITSASMSTPAAISEKINYKNEVKSIKETISNQNVDQNITSLLNKGYDFETSVDIVNSALSEKGLQQIDKNSLMENIKQPEKIQNSPIEQQNINNNINNQVNENIQNSMVRTQNNNKVNPPISTTFLNSAKENNYNSNSEVIRNANSIMLKRGIEGRFDSKFFTNNSENALWRKDENGKRSVIFNPNADENAIFQNVVIHEMVHDVLSSKNSADVLNVEDILDFVSKTSGYESARMNLEETYSKVYDRNSDQFKEIVDEEVIATVLGNKLGSQEYINRLNGQKPNLARRIYNWIVNKLDSLSKALGHQSEKAYWRDVANRFERAFNIEYNSNLNETTVNNLNDNEKFSIMKNSVGKYVKADRQVITGNNPLKWEKQVENYINNSIRKGKDVNIMTDNGEILTITKDTAGKAKFRNYFIDNYGNKQYMNDNDFYTKLLSEVHIDELGQISRKINKLPIPDYKNHSFAKNGFDYRTAYFEDFNGDYYKITMSVGKNGTVDTIYNVGKLEQRKRPVISGSSVNNGANGSLTTNNVPQSNQNVKSGTSTKYSMQTKENNTQELDNSSFSNDLSYQGTNHSGAKAYGKKITVDNMYKQIDNLAENNKKNGEALNVINSVKNNPNAKITIYRATPGNNINVGDWVFLTETEADRFSRAIITKRRKIGYKVLKMEVKAKDVDWTGKNLEFVFNPQEQNNYEAIDITNDDIRYSQKSQTWDEFVENNFKSSGTRTKFSEIKAPINPNAITNQNKINPPIAKEYQKNTIEEKKSSHEDVIRVQAEEIANQLNSGKPLNTKERRWIETSIQSDVLKEKIFKEDLDVHKINYEVQSNKKSLKQANNKIDLLGYDGSINYVKDLINNGRIPTATDVAIAQRTLQEAVKKGDTEIAQNLVMDVAILGTELGQATQALSMINKLTPEGQLKLYSKIVHRAKMMGDKSFQDVEITPEMVEMILNAYDKNGNYNQDDLNSRVEQFKQKVADQLKSSVEEKIDAWRYLSMLGNPKTHIRNIVSNIAMKGAIAYKNAIARTIETFAPINTRTKTWKKASQEIKQYAKNTAIEMKNIITGESKYGEKASLESKKRIFKLAPLEAISNFNSNALEVEDWFFSKRAFINTFQEYLTANGINTMEDIQNNPDIVEKGKTYAVEQAEIATFRQYSKLASAINKIERNNKVAKYVIKATIPFKKTPINVAKAGVKYSPLGLIKNVTYDVYQVKKGNINASQFIDNLSQGLSGTSLTLLGYALAKAGILTGANGDDKDDKYDSYLGKQGYSIKIGNKYYSLSWLSPTAMPMFVGANIYEQFEDKKGWDMNVLSESLAKTLDPLNEMSFVSSLTDALNSYGSGNDKIKGMGESVVQSYIGQFFPTLFSQFANVGDDTKRSTKASSNSSYKFGEQTIRSIMYKIPGLRNKLESSTDIWGNEIKQNENILMRALESFILPYSAKEYKNSSIDKEIKKVYNDVGNTDVIPGFPQSYVKYDKVQYRMSAKEYTKFKKTYGTSANTMLNMLTNTSNYKNSTGKRKTRMIKKVYDYSREISKEEFLSNRKIDYDKNDFKYNKNDYKKIVNYITSSTQYKDDD